MNWDALAAVAEAVGAAGVLASLLYLATQIRQNTVWLRQQAFQLGTNEVRRWAAGLSGSHENSELFLKGQRDFRSLDPTERLRFTMMIFELCSVWGTYQEYSGEDLLGLRESAESSIQLRRSRDGPREADVRQRRPRHRAEEGAFPWPIP